MRTSTHVVRISRLALVIVGIALTVVATACSSESGEANAPANEAAAPPPEPARTEAQEEANATPPAAEPAPANPADMEIATGFVEAYGAFDIEQALTYLADGADISGIGGEDFAKLVSWFEAMGYKQTLGPCEVLTNGASRTTLRCPYDFHLLRSDEVGLGPYSGSFFTLAVEDGAIVRVSDQLNYEEEFSPQMWEPFANWVSEMYPEDAAVMYMDESLTMGRLTEESFELWEKRSREYAQEVG